MTYPSAEDLQPQRRELKLGVAGGSKVLRRAESVFRENPEIKQRIHSALGIISDVPYSMDQQMKV